MLLGCVLCAPGGNPFTRPARHSSAEQSDVVDDDAVLDAELCLPVTEAASDALVASRDPSKLLADRYGTHRVVASS